MKYLENVDNEPSERCFHFGDVPDYRLESGIFLKDFLFILCVYHPTISGQIAWWGWGAGYAQITMYCQNAFLGVNLILAEPVHHCITASHLAPIAPADFPA